MEQIRRWALTFTMPPFGARSPRTTASPPAGLSGWSRLRITPRSGAVALAIASASEPPVMVSASVSSSGDSAERRAGTPPAWSKSPRRLSPEGRTSTSNGVRAAISSNRSSVSLTPTRPANASRWTMAFVLPPRAASTVIAFAKAASVRTLLGRKSSKAISTARVPIASARCRPASVHGWDRGTSGDRHSERLDETRHRRRRPHLVAVARRRDPRGLELGAVRLTDPPGSEIVCVPPQIGADTEFPPEAPGRLRRASGQHDRGNIRTRRSHQLGRDRLVAPGDQHHRIEGVRVDALLDVHRHQVAVKHRRRFHQILAERDCRKLDGEAASGSYSTLHRGRKAAEVQVTVDRLRPRVAHADNRTPLHHVRREACDSQACSVQEPGQVVTAEPLRASQVCVAACAHVDPGVRVRREERRDVRLRDPVCPRGIRSDG